MSRKRSRPPLVFRILLVFAADGVTIAADIVDNMADFVFEENPLIKVSKRGICALPLIFWTALRNFINQV